MTFKEWRRKELLLQKELAIMLGCHEATISHWERGTVEPSITHRRAFKECFGFDPVDKFDEFQKEVS